VKPAGHLSPSGRASKDRAPAAQENRAALTRRPHFLSASSLFAACCLPASSPSPCCDASF
ncbi:hypothetical protein, partial [Klebsiella michiganensis]|uniref:hypothetical protein n=1 Tax=Klebsiella michiganensis TaxID=1134687 RepID=UPI001F14FE5F